MCDQHPVFGKQKKHLASFVGSAGTHPIRAKMFEELRGKDGIVFMADKTIDHAGNLEYYREMMETSYFALCPRGYGKTSYRLYEAMQMGCVPVYISDEFWLPFEGDVQWGDFCLTVHPDEIAGLPERMETIISSGFYEEMRSAAFRAYQDNFAYESSFEMIKNILEREVVEK